MKNLIGALAVALMAPAVQASVPLPHQSDPNPPPVVQPAEAEAKPAEAPAPAPAPAATAAAPAAPAPISTIAAQASDKKEEEKSGFSFSTGLSHSVGSGTFARPEYYSYVGAGLDLGASYAFKLYGVKLGASASGALGWEYSLPDNLNGRRFSWGDLRVGLGAPALLTEKTTGITISPNLGLMIPVSLESMAAGTVTVFSGGVSFSRSFLNKISVGYSLSGGAGIHANQVGGTGTPYNINTASAPTAEIRTCVGRATEQRCLTSTNTQYSVSNSLKASYSPIEKLSISMGVGLTNSFRYAQPDDEYTPKTLDSNGNRAAKPGFGRSDSLSGSLSVAYAVTDHVGVDLGMSTGGPPKTSDNQNFRFPFYDALGPEAGRTSFGLGVSAQF